MKHVFHVDGLLCEHCAARLTRVLEEADGVCEVRVSLADQTAAVEAPADATPALLEAIADAGFTPTLIQKSE